MNLDNQGSSVRGCPEQLTAPVTAQSKELAVPCARAMTLAAAGRDRNTAVRDMEWLYVCMYVCMYVCVYMYMYLYLYLYMYVMYVYACMYVSMYLCGHAYMYLCMYECMYGILIPMP